MESDSSIEEYDNIDYLNDSLLRYLDLSQVSDDHNCSHSLGVGDDQDLGHKLYEGEELSSDSQPIIKARANSTFNINSQALIKDSGVRLDSEHGTPLTSQRNLHLSDYFSNSTNYTNTYMGQAQKLVSPRASLQAGMFRIPHYNPLSNPLQKYSYHQQLQDYNSNSNLNSNYQQSGRQLSYVYNRFLKSQLSNTSTPYVNQYVPFNQEASNKVKFNFQSNVNIVSKPVEPYKKSSLKQSVSHQVNYDSFSVEDIKKCIPFMIKEQYGCRFLQKKLTQEEGYADEVIITIAEPFLYTAMIDQFGNYLVQKILENKVGNQKSFDKIQEIVSYYNQYPF